MHRKKLAAIGTVAIAAALLVGCTPAAPTATPSKSAGTKPVAENGDGRIDAGESIKAPNSVKSLVNLACDIKDSKKLTAIDAQQLNSFGQYMSYFQTHPDTINKAVGISTGAEAAKLAAVYIPLSQDIYQRTLKSNIALPADLAPKFDSVCGGDVFLG